MSKEEREVIYNEEGHSNEEPAKHTEDERLTMVRLSELRKLRAIKGRAEQMESYVRVKLDEMESTIRLMFYELDEMRSRLDSNGSVQ